MEQVDVIVGSGGCVGMAWEVESEERSVFGGHPVLVPVLHRLTV